MVVVAAVVGRGFAFVVVIVGVVPLFVVIGLRHSVATTFIARSFEVVGLGGDGILFQFRRRLNGRFGDVGQRWNASENLFHAGWKSFG